MFNRSILIVLVIALAAGLGLVASQRWFGRNDAPPRPELQTVRLFPQARELPPFALQQSDGTQLVPGELHGHWTLVFLGFTHCPDVCPTTLADLSRAQKEWEALPEARRNHPTTEHLYPLYVALGAGGEAAHATRLHHAVQMGGMAMDAFAYTQ